jgi:hypothetical protein
MNATATNAPFIAPATDTGRTGLLHLKRMWSIVRAKKEGQIPVESYADEWATDTTLLNTIGIGIGQVYDFLYSRSESFESFEDWVLSLNGGRIAAEKIARFNAYITGDGPAPAYTKAADDVLTAADLAFWEANGYVVLHDAVSPEACAAAEAAIWHFLEADKEDPHSWYEPHPARHGIMVEFFQHPALQANRDSARIRRAYEQLWGTTDLWVNTDRVSFNPPENEQWQFAGPDLHWDVSLELPVPFGLQGILYLTDTLAHQGAFTLVPGFQHRIEDWIRALSPGTDPRTQDLYALGAVPIAGRAGDMIIWHHALPHGSSPNTATLPRIVQYLNWEPVNREVKEVWK